MSRVKLETSFSPTINITQVHGSLRIKGWDRPEFRGDADLNDTLEVKQNEDTLDVKCSSGCMLRIPVESTLRIGKVNRELLIKSIEGDIEIDEVTQQLILKNVSKTSINTVNSSLNAKQIEGDLLVKTIIGNAVIRDVDGKLEIIDSHGSLNVHGVAIGIDVNTKGNIVIRFEPELEGKYKIYSEGSINCKVSPGAGGKVVIKSKSKAIRVKTPDQSENLNMEEYNFEFGEGNSEIVLNAEGNVSFIAYNPDDAFSEEFEISFDEDFSNLADEITQQVSNQIESQMDALSAHLNEITNSLSIGMISSERSRNKLEAQRRSLERKFSRAQEKMDRKIHAMEARKRAYQHRYDRGKPGEPVSEEERKIILEMLQNQQITVEEAEILLAALEGETPKDSYSAPLVTTEELVESSSAPKENQNPAQKIQTKRKTTKTKTKTTTKKSNNKNVKAESQKKSSSSDTKGESKVPGSKN